MSKPKAPAMRELSASIKWWRSGDQFYRAARVVFEQNPTYFAGGIYSLCCQACYRMLRAYLSSKDQGVDREPTLTSVAKKAAKSLPAIRRLVPALSDLDDNYFGSMYPLEDGKRFRAADAKHALNVTEDLKLQLEPGLLRPAVKK